MEVVATNRGKKKAKHGGRTAKMLPVARDYQGPGTGERPIEASPPLRSRGGGREREELTDTALYLQTESYRRSTEDAWLGRQKYTTPPLTRPVRAPSHQRGGRTYQGGPNDKRHSKSRSRSCSWAVVVAVTQPKGNRATGAWVEAWSSRS
jgi:hypothetical protein